MPVDPVVSRVAGVTVVPYGSHAPEHDDRASRSRSVARHDGSAETPRQRARRTRKPARRRRATPSGARSCPDQLGGHSTDALALGALRPRARQPRSASTRTSPARSATASTPPRDRARRRPLPRAARAARRRGGVLVTRGETRTSRGSDLRLGLGLVLVCAADRRLAAHRHGSPGGDALEPLQQAGGLLGALVRRAARTRCSARSARSSCSSRSLVLGALLVLGAGLRQVAAIAVPRREVARPSTARDSFTLQPVPLDDADVRARPAAALRPGRRRARHRRRRVAPRSRRSIWSRPRTHVEKVDGVLAPTRRGARRRTTTSHARGVRGRRRGRRRRGDRRRRAARMSRGSCRRPRS